MTVITNESSLRGSIELGISRLRADLMLRDPAELYRPASYVLESSGKLLRPRLVHLVAEALGKERDAVAPVALAVEVFHNFTLVHDDIMDHAETRRGRATVHEKWDVGTAILVGDLLMALAYELIGKAPVHCLAELTANFSRMVARLCEGQTLDMQFARRDHVTLNDYIAMIDRKTGALIECCLQSGGIVADADSETIRSLGLAGRELGRAFQIQDDLLDVVATSPKWGKTVGGDLIEGKKAFLLVKALESDSAEVRDWFREVASSGLDSTRVDEARDRLDAAGILEDARRAIHSHSTNSIGHLSVLPESEARSTLLEVVGLLSERQH